MDICTKSVTESKSKDTTSNNLYLTDIIIGKTIDNTIQKRDESPDRFNSVINFPNFLLHVLRIQCQEDIPLDDKRLLLIFRDKLTCSSCKVQFVKAFAFNLLKCKFLFDKYIIKREFIADTDKWSLKKLKWYDGGKVSYVNSFGEEDGDSDENRTIRMLLSMFHVSTPTLVYKHWLNAVLNYVNSLSEIVSADYIKYLEKLANAFLFDRFLTTQPRDYFDIIYTNSSTQKNKIEDIDLTNLTFENLQNNLVFNYLDYLIWRTNTNTDPKIRNFEYTFRSSVEHYYPQHPMPGYDLLEENYLHSFGNLCLISSSKNSSLSNYMPTAKKQHYAAQQSIDSLKQYVMMNEYKPENWSKKTIVDHSDKMISLIMNQFEADTGAQKSHANKDVIKDINSEIKITKSEKWFVELQKTDRTLLARALMCFGSIETETGWTSGGTKCNFFHWENIKGSELYSEYEEYISKNNPNTLEELIAHHLKYNGELRQDSLRFVFVSRPEIIEYCLEGNYGWVNDGKKVILLEGTRANLYNSCELYTFILRKHIMDKYNISAYCSNDRLKVTFIENGGLLDLAPIDFDNGLLLEIWNNGDGQLCYEINTRDLHGNTKFIRNLKETGWDYNSSGKLYYVNKPILAELCDDIELNIIQSQKKFDALIRHIK